MLKLRHKSWMKTTNKAVKIKNKKMLDKCKNMVYNGDKEKRTNVLFWKILLNKGFSPIYIN